jgi:hypothetical protein
MFNQCLHKRESKNQMTKVTISELKDAYIEPSQSKFQVHVERLDVCKVRFGVHCRGNKPTDMEPGFDELRIVSEGLGNP